MNKILSTQRNTSQSWKGKTTMDDSQKYAKWKMSDMKECILCACMHACMHAKSLQSCLALCKTWTIDSPQGCSVHGILQARHWSGLPCPPPGDLPDPGIEPASLTSSALAGRFFTTSDTWEAPYIVWFHIYETFRKRKSMDLCFHKEYICALLPVPGTQLQTSLEFPEWFKYLLC